MEFSQTLHLLASRNIQTFRGGATQTIVSVRQDAGEFDFPQGPLVLYMFYPFGAETMQKVLNNLRLSLQASPRHVVVVLLWPRCGDQIATLDGMRLTHQSRYIQIFANTP